MLGTGPGPGHALGQCPGARDPAHPSLGAMWQPRSCNAPGQAGVGSPRDAPPPFRRCKSVSCRGVVACRGALCPQQAISKALVV